MSNAPAFASDSSLQLSVGDTAETLLDLLIANGEDETTMLKIDVWSIQPEGENARVGFEGNTPTEAVGVILFKSVMYPLKGTPDRIKLISDTIGTPSKLNIAQGVMAKGFV